MSDKYLELDQVLEQESWEYLSDNYPPLAQAVQKAVAQGVRPEDIRRRVIDRLGAHRIALATRCESAARWLDGAGK